MSIQGVRKLLGYERNIIDLAWKNIRPIMKAEGAKYQKVLSWSSVLLNGKLRVDFSQKNEWLDLVKKINHEVFPNTNILIAGYVLNPPNSSNNQVWHNDYAPSVNTLFLPMVDQGCQTATQVIDYPVRIQGETSGLGYVSHYGHDVLDIMDKQGLDLMPVTQIVCRSHTILKMKGGSIHRGISNRSNTQRVMFYICNSAQNLQLNQQQFVQSNLLPKDKNK